MTTVVTPDSPTAAKIEAAALEACPARPRRPVGSERGPVVSDERTSGVELPSNGEASATTGHPMTFIRDVVEVAPSGEVTRRTTQVARALVTWPDGTPLPSGYFTYLGPWREVEELRGG